MPWTALHAALGETDAQLSFGMISRACVAAVEETGAVDWKRALPLTEPRGEGRAHQQAELAKDIAAMANSGGGTIVFGVAETRMAGISAADHVEPVGVVDDTVLQQIRQVAGALIYPPVVGLDLLPLAPGDDPAGGVLALVVPDSVAMPHLVHPENTKNFEYFMAPYRHGPHTERMVEQQLAAAYRQREQRARTRAAQLEQVWADSLAATRNGPAWVIAVAVPETPHPRPREFTLEQANEIFVEICRPGRPGTISALDLTSDASTRRGLRRYHRSWARQLNPPGALPAKIQGQVELHGDGTVVVAATRDAAFPGGSATGGGQEIAICDLEQVGVDLLRALRQAQRRRGFHTDYAVRIGISMATQVFGAWTRCSDSFRSKTRNTGYRSTGPSMGPSLARRPSPRWWRPHSKLSPTRSTRPAPSCGRTRQTSARRQASFGQPDACVHAPRRSPAQLNRSPAGSPLGGEEFPAGTRPVIGRLTERSLRNWQTRSPMLDMWVIFMDISAAQGGLSSVEMEARRGCCRSVLIPVCRRDRPAGADAGCAGARSGAGICPVMGRSTGRP